MKGSSGSLGRFLSALLIICALSMITLVVLRFRLRPPAAFRESNLARGPLSAPRQVPPPRGDGGAVSLAARGNITAALPDSPFYLFPDLPNRRTTTDDERLRYTLVTIAQHLNKTVGTTPELQRWSLLRAKSPRLIYLHSAVDDTDAKELIEFSSKCLERSAVNDLAAPGGSKVVIARSSQGMFLTPGRGSDLSANIRLRRRVASVVGLPPECAESTQILRYENGQEYRPHPDTFSAANTQTLARGGQRILTAIMWLTDVAAGGTTTFPNSVNPTVSVPPRKGDGLVFYNVAENFRDVDITHVHSGDPVRNGTKIVAVLWFHPRMFN
jgi:prolyl 4-hydroxylase